MIASSDVQRDTEVFHPSPGSRLQNAIDVTEHGDLVKGGHDVL